MGRENTAVGRSALPLAGAQHDCAGAVAEQHAGAAIVPVEDAREGLGADHQHRVRLAAAQEVVGGRQRIDEAGADGLDIERSAAMDAQIVLHPGGGGGKCLVGRGGGQHDQVDGAGGDSGLGQRRVGSLGGEIGRQLAVGRDIALADAGALADPFVGSIEALRQFGVGQHLGRQIAAAAGDDRTPHAQAPAA